MYEKIWDAHLVHEAAGQAPLLYIDRHLMHEVTSPQAFESMLKSGRKVRNKHSILATMDHCVPTKNRDLPIADPIAKKQIEIAHQTGADAVSHGATGKGNDQVRFELGYLALDPDIAVIAPWREWDLNSRTKLLAYAAEHGINIDDKGQAKPYSMDANLLHISYEGEHLENPYNEPEENMWLWSVSPEKAPDEAEYITISYIKGDPVAINREEFSPAKMLAKLNEYGNKHGIGRIDIVENRMVGMKARGCYETPGGTIMLKAHRAIESITLDREEAHLKDEMMPKYAKVIYNGFWWSAERKMMQAAIDATQEHVNGDVKLKLYKGNVTVVGRKSEDSLYSEEHSTFEEDEVYDQKDAEGFIRLNALRFIIEGKKQPERIASMIASSADEVEVCKIETGSFTICQRIKRFFGFGNTSTPKEEYIKRK